MSEAGFSLGYSGLLLPATAYIFTLHHPAAVEIRLNIQPLVHPLFSVYELKTNKNGNNTNVRMKLNNRNV